ncbi:hypothetical protein AX774_g603 [Zancudomyces culisetae]|uniref:Uncharacterized protein n=1 Tax=Zancudomyces culisetae TaxID=1213189 RepID=A0A1R1PY08_ZANCU|nr:hypothetical protein AX774_g603 [Zancudomyces culisetae]|eukprot:OMH85844.1 hypothetical protein AX774_g603 [Zancudomyces culisetae]
MGYETERDFFLCFRDEIVAYLIVQGNVKDIFVGRTEHAEELKTVPRPTESGCSVQLIYSLALASGDTKKSIRERGMGAFKMVIESVFGNKNESMRNEKDVSTQLYKSISEEEGQQQRSESEKSWSKDDCNVQNGEEKDDHSEDGDKSEYRSGSESENKNGYESDGICGGNVFTGDNTDIDRAPQKQPAEKRSTFDIWDTCKGVGTCRAECGGHKQFVGSIGGVLLRCTFG